MSRLFKSPSDLGDYLFRIVDNGGATADRYTVIFSDGDYLRLSANPTHPQGVSQWGEKIDPQVMVDWVKKSWCVDIALGDLPEGVVDHVVARCNEALEDFLQSVESCDPAAVAPSRDSAEENDGSHLCAGKGLYGGTGGYFVKLDGEVDHDRGPFLTAREAMIASLPDHYSLAGVEYHSPLDASRTEPSAEVARKVEELEAQIGAGWEASNHLGM